MIDHKALIERLQDRANVWQLKAEMAATENARDLQQEVLDWAGKHNELLHQIEDLKALGDGLAGYVNHDGLCDLINSYDPCTCGLSAVLAAWENKR